MVHEAGGSDKELQKLPISLMNDSQNYIEPLELSKQNGFWAAAAQSFFRTNRGMFIRGYVRADVFTAVCQGMSEQDLENYCGPSLSCDLEKTHVETGFWIENGCQ